MRYIKLQNLSLAHLKVWILSTYENQKVLNVEKVCDKAYVVVKGGYKQIFSEKISFKIETILVDILGVMTSYKLLLRMSELFQVIDKTNSTT